MRWIMCAALATSLTGCAVTDASLQVETLPPGRSEAQAVDQCQVLRTGDPFSLIIESRQPVYVYALRERKDGLQALFPVAGGAALRADKDVRIHLPREAPWYSLEEGEGIERIVAVVSRERLTADQAAALAQEQRVEAKTDITCREPPDRPRESTKLREAPDRPTEKEREAPDRPSERQRGRVITARLDKRGVAVLRLPFRHQ